MTVRVQTQLNSTQQVSTDAGVKHLGVRIVYNVAWAEAYLRTKWHLDPSSRLATTDIGRKLGAVPLRGGAGSPSNTMSPGWRSTCLPSGILIHPAVWPQQTWAENWGCCAPFGGAWSPSNTMWPGPRPMFRAKFHLGPSNCLGIIHQRYIQERTGQTTVR